MVEELVEVVVVAVVVAVVEVPELGAPAGVVDAFGAVDDNGVDG